MARDSTATAMTLSDAEIVEVVLGGKIDRYGELVRRHKALVTSYCYSRVAHRETAEDLAQETFVRAYQALAGLKKPSAFAGWLLSIAHNVCIDYLRNKSRTVSLEVHGEKDSQGQIILENVHERAVVDRIAQEELRDRILKAIESMSEDYRVTLMLRHVGGLSCEEIADSLGVSLGTVTSRLSRAHKLLREKLAAMIEGTK